MKTWTNTQLLPGRAGVDTAGNTPPSESSLQDGGTDKILCKNMLVFEHGKVVCPIYWIKLQGVLSTEWHAHFICDGFLSKCVFGTLANNYCINRTYRIETKDKIMYIISNR